MGRACRLNGRRAARANGILRQRALTKPQATIYQDIEIPRGGEYRLWVRYADWANRSEPFVIRLMSYSGANANILSNNLGVFFSHEFGAKDVIDPHDEVSMYWGWAFAWDSATLHTFAKGPLAYFDRDRKSWRSTATRRLLTADE